MVKCKLCYEAHSLDKHIYETKNTFCIVAKWPLKEGHVLILPKRHVIKFSKLTKEEAKELFDEVEKMQSVLKKIYHEDTVININRGKLGSQHHIHIHVVPSKAGLRPLIARLENIPEVPKVSLVKMKKMAQKIKKAMKR